MSKNMKARTSSLGWANKEKNIEYGFKQKEYNIR